MTIPPPAPARPGSRPSPERTAWGKHQPISVTAVALRALMQGGTTASLVWQSLASCAGILLVFVRWPSAAIDGRSDGWLMATGTSTTMAVVAYDEELADRIRELISREPS